MDNGLIFLFNWNAERYLVGTNFVRYFVDSYDSRAIMMETEDADEKMYSVKIKCHSDYAMEKVRDRICESLLNNHPGVIDLRGIEINPSDIEEE